MTFVLHFFLFLKILTDYLKIFKKSQNPIISS